MNERLLIIEDDADMRELLQEVAAEAGYQTVTAGDGQAGRGIIENAEEAIDVVITDVQLPNIKGDELLQIVRRTRRATPVIIITAFGSVEQAIEMVKGGAFQYLTKPFTSGDFLSVVEHALAHTAPHRAQAALQRHAVKAPRRIIGASRQIKQLYDLINRAAQTAGNVLITGESGTGKELVARAVHESSNRTGAFIAVNCAAIPDELIEAELFGHTGGAFTGARHARSGLFEAADGGTILLDEIGELPLSVQPKLLRVLQESTVRAIGSDRERRVNVRVIAATNRDLEREVEAARFREDLYWRLNVIHLHVAPLRERPFDIPLLVEHFLQRESEANNSDALEFSAEALAMLVAYPFPGNVRELENAIQRACAFASGALITPDDLPERIRTAGEAAAIVKRSSAQRLTLAELEREYILETLRLTNNNKSRAAELLGLDRKTLYRKLEDYEAK